LTPWPKAALVVPSLDALLASLNEVEVEHGRAEGLIDGLALALERKFGAAAAPVIAEVCQLSDLAQIGASWRKSKPPSHSIRCAASIVRLPKSSACKVIHRAPISVRISGRGRWYQRR
jgi:hypothetical protein